MIELENQDIGFAAVNARVRLEKLGDETTISIAVFLLERLPFLLEYLCPIMISHLVMLVLAKFAIGTITASFCTCFIKIGERFCLATFAAFLHAITVA